MTSVKYVDTKVRLSSSFHVEMEVLQKSYNICITC